MTHLRIPERLQKNITMKYYQSGHMMYLRAEDLETSNEHIREFVRASLPAEGQPASYPRVGPPPR